MPPDHVAAFYGDRAVPNGLRRRVLTIADVPANNDGLRALAASGNWAAVQNLSAKLAQQQIDRQTGKRDIEPYLEYALVQATALCQTEQYSHAYEVLKQLGDLDGASFNDTKGRSVVPFSLRFLHAVVPQYLPTRPPDAAERLVRLLARVERERSALAAAAGASADDEAAAGGNSSSGGGGRSPTATTTTTMGSDDAAARAGGVGDELLRAVVDGGTAASLGMSAIAELRSRNDHRLRRVLRALAVHAFLRSEHHLGLEYMRQLADAAMSAVESAFLLQQMGCAALRCGDVFAAEEAFKAVTVELAEEFGDNDADTADALEAIVAMNTAFVDVFKGHFNEAVKRLHEIAAPLLGAGGSAGADVTSPPPAPSGASTSLASEVIAANAQQRRTGPLPATLAVRLLAVNSYVVLHQYTQNAERCTIPNSIASLEGLMRRMPVEAARIHPTLLNLRRLYEWQLGGGASARRAMLESTVDAFVTARDALPWWFRSA